LTANLKDGIFSLFYQPETGMGLPKIGMFLLCVSRREMAGVALFKTVNDALPLHVCIHQLKIPFLGASRINYISANAAQHQSVEAKKYKSEALTFHRWIEAIPQTNIQFYRFIQGMQNAVMTCLAIFLDN